MEHRTNTNHEVTVTHGPGKYTGDKSYIVVDVHAVTVYTPDDETIWTCPINDIGRVNWDKPPKVSNAYDAHRAARSWWADKNKEEI
jgi:hypothetical protein